MTTYSELKQRIQDTLEREDSTLVTNIDDFMRRAELLISRQLKTLGFTEVATSNMASGDAVYEKPKDLLEVRSINFGSGSANNTRANLRKRQYEYLRDYWPDDSQTGTPRFYADYNYTHWIVAPTPDAAYPFEVLYYPRIDALTSSNTTNWLTENAEDLYFYAVMEEAMLYLKNDERAAVWAGKRNEALQLLVGQDRRRMVDKSQNAEA